MSDSATSQTVAHRLSRPWNSPGKNTGVGCHFLLQCMKVKNESEAAQSCPTVSDPMDYSPPGSSLRGILQARTLEWGDIAFSSSSTSLFLNFFFSVLLFPHFLQLSAYITLYFVNQKDGKIGQSILTFAHFRSTVWRLWILVICGAKLSQNEKVDVCNLIIFSAKIPRALKNKGFFSPCYKFIDKCDPEVSYMKVHIHRNTFC